MEISSISEYINMQSDVSKNKAEDAASNFQPSLEAALASQDDEALKKSCDQLESYWIAELFKQMKSSMLTGDTLFGKGDYEEMFEDQLFDALAEEMVEAGGIGLSDAMYKQMTNVYKSQSNLTETQSVDIKK